MAITKNHKAFRWVSAMPIDANNVLLEALACGAPLVTTTGTVMAELAGDAALTAPAGSVADLADALGRALEGEGAAERRRLGLEVASGHSREASAEAHMEAYRWAVDAYRDSSPGAVAGDR